MRRHDEIAINEVWREKGVVESWGFHGEDIETCPGEVTGSQGFGEVDLIDKGTPAHIEEKRPRFH